MGKSNKNNNTSQCDLKTNVVTFFRVKKNNEIYLVPQRLKISLLPRIIFSAKSQHRYQICYMFVRKNQI